MSMSMRFTLSLAVLVAALVLVVPGGVAFAATEDVTVGSPEPAQGKPDDWGSPHGNPDDWGKPESASSSDQIPKAGPADRGSIPDSEIELRITLAVIHLPQAL